MTVTWGVPKSPLESLKNPFSRPAGSEGPVLLNRESSSLTLKEDSIQEIVANVSLSLEVCHHLVLSRICLQDDRLTNGFELYTLLLINHYEQFVHVIVDCVESQTS